MILVPYRSRMALIWSQESESGDFDASSSRDFRGQHIPAALPVALAAKVDSMTEVSKYPKHPLNVKLFISGMDMELPWLLS